MKFKNPNFNTFVVRVSAVNDTDAFVKPRECKIGTNPLTNQLIPRNWDQKALFDKNANAPGFQILLASLVKFGPLLKNPKSEQYRTKNHWRNRCEN